MDYPVLAGCGLTRLVAAKVLPLVFLVCQRGCKWSTNLLQLFDIGHVAVFCVVVMFQ